MKARFAMMIVLAFGTIGTAHAATLCGQVSFTCQDTRPNSDAESCYDFLTADNQAVYRVDNPQDKAAINNSGRLGRMCFDERGLTRVR